MRGIGRWTLLSGAGAVVLILISIYMALLYAPTDAVQGNAQRIFYLHLPAAILAYVSYVTLAGASVLYLWKGKPEYDRAARAAAEISLLFITLVLIGGAIWAKPIWGTWWQWDARLTTTLILWFIVLGYFMVRSYAGEASQAAKYAAVLAIFGLIDIPIIHMSVQWWRTLHPEPVVLDTAGPNLPNSMLVTVMVALVGFFLLYIHMFLLKWHIETVRDRIDEREADLLMQPANPPAYQSARNVTGTPEGS